MDRKTLLVGFLAGAMTTALGWFAFTAGGTLPRAVAQFERPPVLLAVPGPGLRCPS